MMITTRNTWNKLLRIITVLALSTVPLCSTASTQSQPNMIVILLDDLSADAMQALLDGGWLPNIQTHLIDAGVTFDNAFVTTPECCPSRTTLLRGQYAHNHLVVANHSLNPLKGGIAWPGWLPENGQPGREQSTIATWLQNAGYRTGFIGKYLNGYGEHAPEGVDDPKTYIPPGWDTWNGLISPTQYRVYNYEISDNGSTVQYGEEESDYQTDVLASRAVDFVSSQQTQPFFLFIASLAPHIEVLQAGDVVTGNDPVGGFNLNIRPAPRHVHLMDGDASNGELPLIQQKPSFNESDVSSKPSCPRPLPPEEPTLVSDPYCVAERPLLEDSELTGLNNQYKSMLASIIAIDDMVGSLITSLNSVGKLDNTAIIFTSDNGWFYGEHRMIGKELAYEESIRVPFIMRAPGGKTGSTSSEVILNNDIAPTLADLANVVPPYDPDGTSIMPLVDSNPTSTWFDRKRFLVERWYVPSLLKFDSPTYLALRSLTNGQNYTYIASRTNPDTFDVVTHHELYDISTDQYQLNNILLPSNVTSALDDFLVIFRSCSGAMCRALESF